MPSPSPTLVLIVDDHDDSIESLSLLLEAFGYTVITARNGAEGLAKARQERPFAILTDIGMPVMDGYAFAESIRADPELKDTFIIAVSGFGKEAYPDASAAGVPFDRHLLKPANSTGVIEALTAARARLQRSRVETERR